MANFMYDFAANVNVLVSNEKITYKLNCGEIVTFVKLDIHLLLIIIILNLLIFTAKGPL